MNIQQLNTYEQASMKDTSCHPSEPPESPGLFSHGAPAYRKSSCRQMLRFQVQQSLDTEPGAQGWCFPWTLKQIKTTEMPCECGACLWAQVTPVSVGHTCECGAHRWGAFLPVAGAAAPGSFLASPALRSRWLRELRILSENVEWEVGGSCGPEPTSDPFVVGRLRGCCVFRPFPCWTLMGLLRVPTLSLSDARGAAAWCCGGCMAPSPSQKGFLSRAADPTRPHHFSIWARLWPQHRVLATNNKLDPWPGRLLECHQPFYRVSVDLNSLSGHFRLFWFCVFLTVSMHWAQCCVYNFPSKFRPLFSFSFPSASSLSCDLQLENSGRKCLKSG